LDKADHTGDNLRYGCVQPGAGGHPNPLWVSLPWCGCSCQFVQH
jgi:hypothetical protein